MKVDLTKIFTKTIKPIPPFSFELTVHRPAGWSWLTPFEVYDKKTIWTATRIKSRIIGLKLKSIGNVEKPDIICDVFSDTDTTQTERLGIINRVERYLGANEDIREFYSMAERDPILKQVVKNLYGMRDGSGDLFPLLTLATTLQMAPIKRSDQMMDLLIKNYGDSVTFDGKTILMWPSAERIARTSVRELKERCKLGYRAKNLRMIAKTLTKGFLDMDELESMSPEDARKKLMELQGIGEYSVGIVAPHPGFPVDSWSAKIFHILFFGRRVESPRDVIEKVREKADERWGRWKGLAFVYVLNDLKNLSSRYDVNFTEF